MKLFKTILISTIIMCSHLASAQVSVNVNIGSPPLWGPVGYSEVQYYYIPDVEAYYDVPTSMFIYYSGGSWIRRAYLPTRYRYYDLYSGYKVVLTDYRGNAPYIHFKNHKVKYHKGYKGGSQKTIGEKPGKGNNKSSSPSQSKHHAKPQQNNVKSGNTGGSKKSSQNMNSGGGQKNSNSGPGNGSKSHQGGGNHGGGGKKK